ncbi:MAG: hypothetical protein L0219_16065 [Phycisphaerales bacterium]|nr:hypothetical protein [Phycisphaerales bacterium]
MILSTKPALRTQYLVQSTAPVHCLAVSMFLAGCGGGGDFPTAPTSGRVICEGQPAPHVMVFFEPLQTGKKALVGKQGFAIAKADGSFSISTYGTNDGAVVGPHRVRVGPPHSEDHPGYKCACYLNSEVDLMEVDVKKGAKNEFELVLKKKTGREPKPLPDD